MAATKTKPFAPKFADRSHAEASGQAALALAVALLDVLARKTQTLSDGEVSLIISEALRYLPSSPHRVDESAREIVSDLIGKIRR